MKNFNTNNRNNTGHYYLMPTSVNIVLVLLSALSIFYSPLSLSFNLFGQTWSSGEATVYVDIEAANPSGSNPPNVVAGGPTAAQLDAAYIEAMNLWTNNSTFSYIANISGAIGDPCPFPSTDPLNGVVFADITCSGAFGGATLAVQQRWFSGSEITKTGTIFKNTIQWDLYTGPWNGTAEFKRVAVHELGHGLGLDHSAVPDAIMQPTAGTTEVPQADDIAGVAAMYDVDADGIGTASDNCNTIFNPSQTNTDGDSLGDDCDWDIDGDGVYDSQGNDVSHGLDPIGNSLFAAGPSSSNSSFPIMAQTFLATVNGNLDRVDLPYFCPTGDMTLEIRTVSGNSPTSTVLNSTVFTNGAGVPSTNSELVEFPLSSPLSITAGTDYAIVTSIAGECRWFTAPAYADGVGLLITAGGFESNLGDFAFQTVVSPVTPDNCPLVINPLQTDTDNNGVGDACQTVSDADMDGIEDALDNCPAIANPGQENFDADTMGDACDPDDDNDNLTDADEISIYFTDPLDADTDDDGVNDGDEVLAGTDPTIADVTVPILGVFGALLLSFVMLIIARRGSIIRDT